MSRRMRTTAKRVEGGYLLNGVERFITNGGIADVHVIFATTDPAAGWAASRRSWSIKATLA